MDAGLSPKLGHLINHFQATYHFEIFLSLQLKATSFEMQILFVIPRGHIPSIWSFSSLRDISVFPNFDFDHKFDSSAQPQNVIAKKPNIIIFL